VLDLLGLRPALSAARLVITGEGRLDQQSLAGKGPIGIARVAAASGVPVVAVAGINLLRAEELAGTGISAVYTLAELEPDPRRSMAGAAELLSRVGARVAVDLLGRPETSQ
ncbi:MAG: glycerate kinase, partial [Micropruina sp.]